MRILPIVVSAVLIFPASFAVAANDEIAICPGPAHENDGLSAMTQSMAPILPRLVLPPQERKGSKYEETELKARKNATFCHVRDDAIIGVIIHHSASSEAI